MSSHPGKNDLEIAISRLDTKISVLEMQLNSKNRVNSWPSRAAWRGLFRMAQQVVDEYYKEVDSGQTHRHRSSSE